MNVMSQIKPTQIIPEKETRLNPYSSLPSDLASLRRGAPRDVPLEETGTSDEVGSDTGEGTEQSLGLQETTDLSIVDPTPGTPAIIGVKEQVVSFSPDGTAKIDLILEIEDIEGAVEYDIRVAKNAGNL